MSGERSLSLSRGPVPAIRRLDGRIWILWPDVQQGSWHR